MPFQPGQSYDVLDPAALAAMPGIAFLQGLVDGTMPAPPFAEVAEIEPITVAEGKVTFRGWPSRRFYNPMGTVHGGWISLILDTVMGCAVHSVLPAGYAYTTVEMKTVYAKALREEHGPVTCEAVLVHKGAQIAGAEGKLYDAKGRLIAYGSETCLLRALHGPRE